MRASRFDLLLALALPFALGLAACGDEEAPAKAEFPENPGPVSLSVEQRGLPLSMNRTYSANRVKYETLEGDATSVFVYAQVYSEYVEATEGATGATNFDERIDAIYEDLPAGGTCDQSGGCYGSELARYDNHYLVLDLQRRDREYLVDWEGLQRDEEGNRDSLTFERQDYRDAIRDRLVAAVQLSAPEAVIIGAEMNRYHLQNPSDWANFASFYWDAYDAVKEADSSVRVGPGFNWSFLMESNVAAFVEGSELAEDVEPFERAYETIVEPLLTRGDGTQSDFIGLAAIPEPALYDNVPANVPDQHFAGLRIVLPEGSTPIVWFQLGWPVRNAGSSSPADWYRRFLALAGGTTVERVSWWGLANLLPADCSALTGNVIGAADSLCFPGMFSVSGADTALSDAFFERE